MTCEVCTSEVYKYYISKEVHTQQFVIQIGIVLDRIRLVEETCHCLLGFRLHSFLFCFSRCNFMEVNHQNI